MCEEIDSSCLGQGEVNQVLGKVVEHMKPEMEASLQEVACKAMFNMIDFASMNFNSDVDRNQIMGDCCTAATRGP